MLKASNRGCENLNGKGSLSSTCVYWLNFYQFLSLNHYFIENKNHKKNKQEKEQHIKF